MEVSFAGLSQKLQQFSCHQQHLPFAQEQDVLKKNSRVLIQNNVFLFVATTTSAEHLTLLTVNFSYIIMLIMKWL
jgi:hypothetical protein